MSKTSCPFLQSISLDKTSWTHSIVYPEGLAFNTKFGDHVYDICGNIQYVICIIHDNNSLVIMQNAPE